MIGSCNVHPIGGCIVNSIGQGLNAEEMVWVFCQCREGNDYVINGRKWWTSGAMDPRCQLLIVMVCDCH